MNVGARLEKMSELVSIQLFLHGLDVEVSSDRHYVGVTSASSKTFNFSYSFDHFFLQNVLQTEENYRGCSEC